MFLLDELSSAVCWGLGLKQGAIKRETNIKRGKWKEAKRNAAKFFFLFHSVREIPQTKGSVTAPRQAREPRPHGPAATGPGGRQHPRGGQGPRGARAGAPWAGTGESARVWNQAAPQGWLLPSCLVGREGRCLLGCECQWRTPTAGSRVSPPKECSRVGMETAATLQRRD